MAHLPSLLRSLLLALAGLWWAGGARAAEPLAVVTGNTVVQDLTVRIGGDRVAATCLLAPGVDPHTYQPVPEDAKRLAQARLVIINGLGFEGWFQGLGREAGFHGTLVVATSGIQPLKMAPEGHVGPITPATAMIDDPHAFNSMENGIRYAENIRDALITADPPGTDAYAARARAVIGDLAAADAWAKEQFATIPPSQRLLITNHDALQYFARSYGFTILAPNTALEDSEPSAQDLANLVDFIKSHHVKGVFLEYGKNRKVIEQVAREAGVTLGAELYLDGVGPPGSPAATYVGMFRTNVQRILDGLR